MPDTPLCRHLPLRAGLSHMAQQLAPNTLSRLRERCPERGSEGETASQSCEGVRGDRLPPHCRVRDISPLRGEKIGGLCDKVMCDNPAFKGEIGAEGLSIGGGSETDVEAVSATKLR